MLLINGRGNLTKIFLLKKNIQSGNIEAVISFQYKITIKQAH